MKDKKYTKLYNGDQVKEGSLVEWVDSDGYLRCDIVKRGQNGKLYFWNSQHDILEYTSARKVCP